jgi:hypothetical protein
VLRRTGDRLRAFAASLNLPFGFHPLLLSSFPARLAADRLELDLHPDEMLAINCVLFLHRLRSEELADFLRWVKSLSPDVVSLRRGKRPPSAMTTCRGRITIHGCGDGALLLSPCSAPLKIC